MSGFNERNIFFDLDRVANILESGGLIAIPTDTIYGLAVLSSMDSAVEKVFQIKGRSESQALPLLLGSVQQINDYADGINDDVIGLVNEFWPGSLTLIVKKTRGVSEIVSGGLPSVALRLPDHPIPRAISERMNSAITGTSVNRSGEPPFNDAKSIYEEFGDEIDLIVEYPTKKREFKPSTILDVTSEPWVLLREASIPRLKLEEFLGIGFIK
ncbi:MAG: threonylcarbamoyl-AMP synthase [Chloroflexi bacterium]|nr:threonylcarbamoyl-AMP synthase [Chloroflexota bacterium]|tara:strand:+ start:9526 stop:10164 length:639 start_codon:yes stop_codon:yes gene_type:complete